MMQSLVAKNLKIVFMNLLSFQTPNYCLVPNSYYELLLELRYMPIPPSAIELAGK